MTYCIQYCHSTFPRRNIELRNSKHSTTRGRVRRIVFSPTVASHASETDAGAPMSGGRSRLGTTTNSQLSSDIIREECMPRALNLRLDYSANDLRRLAAKTKDGAQATRLLALAAVAEGLSRNEAARIGGMKPQTLRLWVQRFNKLGPDGLLNRKSTGRPPKLNPAAEERAGRHRRGGSKSEADGVTRWRLADLVVVIKERFGVEHDEVSVRRILKELGFSYSSGATRVSSPYGRRLASGERRRSHQRQNRQRQVHQRQGRRRQTGASIRAEIRSKVRGNVPPSERKIDAA